MRVRSLLGAALLCFWACLLFTGAPVPAVAQVAVSPAESRYILSRTELEAVQRQIETLRPSYSRIVESLSAARRAGDDRRAEEIYPDFIEPAARMTALGIELRERSRDFQVARRDYLRALEARLDEIVEQLEDPTLPSFQRDRLETLYSEMSQTYGEVQRERDPVEEAMLRPLPTFAIAETDGPQELRDKASYLENEVAGDYEAVIAFTTQEIVIRERRLRMEREGADLRADLSRFDADRLPGTGVGGTTGAARPEDGDMILDGPFIFADLPMNDQVEILRSIRAQAAEARTEALERAELFRARAGGERT